MKVAAAKSRSTRCSFTRDHPLCALRWVSMRIERAASSARGSESTQPKHRASSTTAS